MMIRLWPRRVSRVKRSMVITRQRIRGAVLVLFPMLIIAIYLQYLHASIYGVPPGYTGAPYDAVTCATLGCHPGPVTHVTGLIQTDIPPLGFLPSDTYNITLNVSRPSTNIFGFQISAGDEFFPVGRFLINDPVEMQFALNENYVTHRLAGTSGNNQKEWQMQWVAPDDPMIDPVTIYASFVAGTFLVNDEVLMTNLPITMNQSVPGPMAGEGRPVAFPNPFGHRLVLRWPYTEESLKKVYLSNTSGQVVYSARDPQVNNGEYVINTGGLPAGTYFLEAVSGSRIHRQKLICNPRNP
jgi:hypothetical protein